MVTYSPTHSHPAPGAPYTAPTEILAVIVAEEPHGATADQVARALGLGLDGQMTQGELEELVMRGLLDRRGLGRGALYAFSAAARERTQEAPILGTARCHPVSTMAEIEYTGDARVVHVTGWDKVCCEVAFAPSRDEVSS